MNERITRVSSGEAGEPDRTDWKRLREMSDAEIEAAIANDPDASLGEDGDVASARGIVFRDAAGAWRWRLVDPAGQAIADSPRSYVDRAEVDRAIATLRAAILAGEAKAA